MKTLIVAAVVLLSGCATVENEVKDTYYCTTGSPKCSWTVRYNACLSAAENGSTPEVVAIEKLRCDTQKASAEAQRSADYAEMQRFQERHNRANYD